MKKSEALKILGLSDGASDEDIKKAHRQKVRENHPDQFSDPTKKASAEEKTKLINEARDVLVNHKWDPEYGPRTGGYGNPYTNPYTTYRPNTGPSQTGGYQQGGPAQGGRPYQDDPFYGWPFETVWTSWDDIGGTNQQGQGANPFDPFSSVFTQTPKKTAAEEFDDAKRSLNMNMVALVAKLAVLGICTLFGNLATGLFIYMLATIVFAVFQRSSGCGEFIIIPIIFLFGPLFALFTPRTGTSVTAGLLVFFGIAVAYDVGTIRRSIAQYNTAKEKAKVSQ